GWVSGLGPSPALLQLTSLTLLSVTVSPATGLEKLARNSAPCRVVWCVDEDSEEGVPRLPGSRLSGVSVLEKYSVHVLRAEALFQPFELDSSVCYAAHNSKELWRGSAGGVNDARDPDGLPTHWTVVWPLQD
ncbi:hypothetical protein CRENBAI_026549, partial [Crenichthys baileyi]